MCRELAIKNKVAIECWRALVARFMYLYQPSTDWYIPRCYRMANMQVFWSDRLRQTLLYVKNRAGCP